MNLRFALIFTAFMCSIACAQATTPIGTVTHHLTFRELDHVTHLPVSNPNGIIEPGEAALISLSMSFTPPVGTVILYPPPHPGPLTLAALRGSLIEVFAYSGVWHDWALRPGWDAYAPGGRDPAGTLYGTIIGGIIIQQLAEGADPSNPAENIWHGIWQPSSYTDRVEYFNTWHWGISSYTALWLNYAGPPQEYFTGQAYTNFSFIQIPIAIPAPGAGALWALGLAAGAARRRRNRS